MADTDDTINIGTAFALISRRRDGRPAPLATCPTDGEPVVATIEYPGAEFLCVVCGRKLGFLAPVPVEATDEMVARHAELRDRYRIERAEREAAKEVRRG